MRMMGGVHSSDGAQYSLIVEYFDGKILNEVSSFGVRKSIGRKMRGTEISRCLNKEGEN
jgi:hypothetical protein